MYNYYQHENSMNPYMYDMRSEQYDPNDQRLFGAAALPLFLGGALGGALGGTIGGAFGANVGRPYGPYWRPVYPYGAFQPYPQFGPYQPYGYYGRPPYGYRPF